MEATMKKFMWLRDSCVPRKGPRLIKGQEHNVKDYPEAVVEEWVRTKAAKYVEVKAVVVDSPKKSGGGK